jgi:hypothetical protein
MTETVLDRVLDSLRSAGNISRAYQVRPAAMLWTDHEGQWRRLAERLRAMLPELLMLGDHAPEERRGPEWKTVWERYRGGWRAFPKVIERLKLASLPAQVDLLTDLRHYPQANEEAEDKLRSGLAALAGLEPSAAASRLKALEQEQGARRRWLWAEMGQAPLAQALEPLSRLVALTEKPFGGQRLEDMAGAYRDGFWQVDAAARQVLAGLRTKARHRGRERRAAGGLRALAGGGQPAIPGPGAQGRLPRLHGRQGAERDLCRR